MQFFRQTITQARRLWARLVHPTEDEVTRALVHTLGRVSAFESLSRDALRDLAEVIHARAYRQGEVIYYEGDPGLGLYVVQTGTVRLLATDDSGVGQPVRMVTAHDLLGDLSLLGGSPRIETAQAATEVRVLGLFRPDLTTLFRRSPKTGVALLEALTRHVAARQVVLLDLLTKRMGRTEALHLFNGIRDVKKGDEPETSVADVL